MAFDAVFFGYGFGLVISGYAAGLLINQVYNLIRKVGNP